MQARYLPYAVLCLACATAPAAAQAVAAAEAIHGLGNVVGKVKRLQGKVSLQRGAQDVPLRTGTLVHVGDRFVTATDGTIGLTLADDTRLTAGPSSSLVISEFSFDSTTHEGGLLAVLPRGTLHVATGSLAKQTPLSVTVQTPHARLGVHGTEFIVDARGVPGPAASGSRAEGAP